MGRTHATVTTCLRRGALCVGLSALLLLALAPAAPAARSGRVGPENRWSPWTPGTTAESLRRDGYVYSGIWDAQPTGTLVYTMTEVAPEMTLTATDASGTPVWHVNGGDVSAASGTLPAAFVAVFAGSDPNGLRSGELVARNADGTVRFRKTFTNEFVQPLCDTAKRLVWVEVSARKVTRVYVRQGSTTRSIALPYRPPQPTFVVPSASSANGSRLAVGTYMHRPSSWRTMLYWLRVSSGGVPVIVSHKVTDWSLLALSPDGSHAAVATSGNGPNLWVDFGRFAGRWLPGENAGELAVGPQRIFAQGGYSYESDAAAWSTRTVEILDWSLGPLYQRAWVWNDSSSSIWFRYDPGIFYLAGVDNAGALTVINAFTWAIATVPGVFSDAVPIDGGKLATMTLGGVLSIIANPVAGP